MPWQNCASLSVDNTNATMGKRNSVGSRFLEKNPNLFIGGCPCHLAHIAAGNANDPFSKCIVLNVEDVCVDRYYWFDKNTKRKAKLLEYFDFCDQEYQAVLKHLSVRWLSLEKCPLRVLKKFPSLKSYFLSEYFSDGRFQRLNEWLSDPLVEPPFLFTQAKISIFTNFSLLLQREEPTLHILKLSIERLGTKIANRIVKPSFLKNIISVADIDLTEDSILLDPKIIFLGVTTKATMNRLLNNGDITQETYDHIHKDVQLYSKDALDYIQRKFPISDPVICNSRWVDVLQRDKAE